MVFSPLCSSGDSEIELHEYDPFLLSRKREKVLDSASQDIIYQVCAGNHSDSSCSMELRLGYCHLPQNLICYGFAVIYLHIIIVRRADVLLSLLLGNMHSGVLAMPSCLHLAVIVVRKLVHILLQRLVASLMVTVTLFRSLAISGALHTRERITLDMLPHRLLVDGCM